MIGRRKTYPFFFAAANGAANHNPRAALLPSLYLTPLDVRDVVHSSCPPPPGAGAGAGGGCSRRLIARTAAHKDDQRSKFRSQQKQSSPPRRFRDQAPRPRSLSSKRHSGFKKGKTIEGGNQLFPRCSPSPSLIPTIPTYSTRCCMAR